VQEQSHWIRRKLGQECRGRWGSTAFPIVGNGLCGQMWSETHFNQPARLARPSSHSRGPPGGPVRPGRTYSSHPLRTRTGMVSHRGSCPTHPTGLAVHLNRSAEMSLPGSLGCSSRATFHHKCRETACDMIFTRCSAGNRPQCVCLRCGGIRLRISGRKALNYYLSEL
jgi:hypothetical protein